jgi:hypothetical protein
MLFLHKGWASRSIATLSFLYRSIGEIHDVIICASTFAEIRYT